MTGIVVMKVIYMSQSNPLRKIRNWLCWHFFCVVLPVSASLSLSSYWSEIYFRPSCPSWSALDDQVTEFLLLDHRPIVHESIFSFFALHYSTYTIIRCSMLRGRRRGRQFDDGGQTRKVWLVLRWRLTVSLPSPTSEQQTKVSLRVCFLSSATFFLQLS